MKTQTIIEAYLYTLSVSAKMGGYTKPTVDSYIQSRCQYWETAGTIEPNFHINWVGDEVFLRYTDKYGKPGTVNQDFAFGTKATTTVVRPGVYVYPVDDPNEAYDRAMKGI